MRSLKYLSVSFAICVMTTTAHAQDDGWKEIQKTVSRLYATISFKDTGSMRIDSMAFVFTENGRLTANYGGNPVTWPVAEYIAVQKEKIRSQHITSVQEIEQRQRTQIFGKIAHVFSTYRLTYVVGGKTTVRRGINSIQLVLQDNEWKIISLMWDNEREGVKVGD